MVAAIEKMTRRTGTEVSWHGLESQTEGNASLTEWAERGGLDWRAHKQNLFTPIAEGIDLDSLASEGIEIVELDGKPYMVCKDQVAVIRDKDFRVLGYHGPDYEIVQPIDTIEQLDAFVSVDERFKWETMGSLSGGRKIFALATYQDEMKVLGEAHTPYLLAATSFDGSMATTLAATLTRVVCQNTLRWALADKRTGQISLRHRTEFTDAVKAKMRNDLQNIINGFAQYGAMAEAMAKVKIAEDAAKSFLANLIFTSEEVEMKSKDGKSFKVMSEPSTKAKGLIEKLHNSYDLTIEEGTDKGTAWAIANAITRYADHEMGTRLTEKRKAEGETEQSIKLESKIFGAADMFKQNGIKSLIAANSLDVKKILATVAA